MKNVLLQLLPDSFYLQYGTALPKNVYFRVPTGDVWSGTSCKNSSRVKGLEDMMEFYGVKPYHVLYVEYNGADNFYLEIFNTYAVEIYYPRRSVCSKKRKVGENVFKSKNVLLDVEVYKLCSTLCYNALYNSRAVYELVIMKEHLAVGQDIPVCILNYDYFVYYIMY